MKKQFLFLLIGILPSSLNTMEQKNNINNRNEIIEMLKTVKPNTPIKMEIENKSVIFPPNFNKYFKCNNDYINYMKNSDKIELNKNNIIFLLPPSNYDKKDYKEYIEYICLIKESYRTEQSLNKKDVSFLNNLYKFVNNIKLDIHMEEETTKKIEVNQKDMENQNNHKKEKNKKKKEKKKIKRQNNLMGNKESEKKDIKNKESDESEEKDTIKNLEEEFSILNFASKVENEIEFFKSLEKNTSLQKSQNKKTSHSKNKYLKSLRSLSKKN